MHEATDPGPRGENASLQAHGRPCCKRAGGSGRGALVEPAALAALLSQTTHGYDVRRHIAEITGGQLEVDAGGLYRVLRRLEDEGFVVSKWVEGESGPQRRDYDLTAEGRQLAEDWIAHLKERARISGLLAGALSDALASTGVGTAGRPGARS